MRDENPQISVIIIHEQKSHDYNPTDQAERQYQMKQLDGKN